MFYYLLLLPVVIIGLLMIKADGRFSTPDDLGRAPAGLKYTLVLMRHGIRGPFWDPLGQNRADGGKARVDDAVLTAAGVNLMRHVGRSLGGRYKDFQLVDSTSVLVTSTKSSRTKLSAQLAVHAMFPGEFPSVESVEVSQETPYDKNTLFYEPSCRVYTQLRPIIEQEEKRDEPQDRSEYFDRLNKALRQRGIQTFQVRTLDDNFKLWDTLNADRLNLKATPSWLDSFLPEMEKLSKLWAWRNTHLKEGMVSFFSGLFLNRVLGELADPSHRQFHVHASHDVTLNAVFWSLGGRETYVAKQGDCIILELQDREVSMYLYSPLEDDSSKRFQPVPLFGEMSCSLDHLQASLQDVLLTDPSWAAKCAETTERFSRDRQEPKY